MPQAAANENPMAEHLSFRTFFMVIVWAPLIESEPQVTETLRHQLPPFQYKHIWGLFIF